MIMKSMRSIAFWDLSDITFRRRSLTSSRILLGPDEIPLPFDVSSHGWSRRGRRTFITEAGVLSEKEGRKFRRCDIVWPCRSAERVCTVDRSGAGQIHG
ncbi:putative fimbrial domain protein [Burkholderia pseudomallei MSHR7500]|nr:putative fimbrial domain protein [Burkholderia pseudomallei MSHR7500]